MNLTDLARQDPNFTVLVPGGCNAKCEFCFWNAKNGRIRPPADYSARLTQTLLALPSNFSAISVSGGEPSISPHLDMVLDTITAVRQSRHYDRVVLTSNGARLDRLYAICEAGRIDHLNISRHAVDDAANEAIFKSKGIPNKDELAGFIAKVHRNTAVDVTMNCVVPVDLTADEATRLIQHARALGFAAISLRKTASDVSQTPAEIAYRREYTVLSENACPVCRGAVMKVNGFEVRWKGTVHEPSIVSGKTYEAVFHPDGNLYADWDMKVPLESPTKAAPPKPTKAVRTYRRHERLGTPALIPPQHAAHTGCGGGYRGCGGGRSGSCGGGSWSHGSGSGMCGGGGRC